jgi:ubiquinone biosynthesis protein
MPPSAWTNTGNEIYATLSRSARVALRSQQIAFVFTTRGLGGLLMSLGVETGKRGLALLGGPASPLPVDAAFGRSLALTFARLGPTFIKLGQALATRPDFIGAGAAGEMRVLFDRVSPISFAEIRRILVRELGRQTVEDAFQTIDTRPLASASIGQTHRGALRDGSPVVIKVQKPHAAEIVRLDLEILEGLVRPAHRHYPRLGLARMFEDFRDAALREIDYREEVKNIDRFRTNYRRLFGSADVLFPRYFPELCTENVIVMEPMRGKNLAELGSENGAAREAASKSLAAVLEQIFDHGFFHADPHAGNLFFLEEDGRLGFIDLGLVGRLEPEDKRKFLKVLLAILQRDRKRLAKSLYDLGSPGATTEYSGFEADIDELLDEVKDTGVHNLRMDQMVSRLLAIARTNDFDIPNRYLMMIRSCLMIEGVAKSLDPSINVAKIATPIVARSLMKSYSPLTLLRRRA